MLVQVVPTQCPACGSAYWDNRQGKNNPKSPDFKCKKASKGPGLPGCEEKPIWLKKGHIWSDDPRAGVSAPATQEPWLDDDPTPVALEWQPKAQAVPPSRRAPAAGGQVNPLQSIAADAAEYIEIAYTVALSLQKAMEESKNAGDTGTADILGLMTDKIQEATATLYIQRKRGGR